MDIILLIVGAFIGFLVSRYYYRRSIDDINKFNLQKEQKEKWQKTPLYFEHMITAGEWQEKFIDDNVTWICSTDISLKIVIPEATDEFIEPWTQLHPDKVGRRKQIKLKINESTILELTFISVDGGRILVPMPRRVVKDNTQTFFWEKDSIEFKVGIIIGYYYIHNDIEGVASMSDISIISGPAGGGFNHQV